MKPKCFDPRRKISGQAVLKNMPAVRQQALGEYLGNHTLKEAEAWLRKTYHMGRIGTSTASISNWFSWYRRVRRFETNASTVEAILEDLKKHHPKITEDELFAHGQRMFESMAIDQEDGDAWTKLQTLRLKAASVKIDQRRLDLLEKRAAQAEAAEKAAGDSTLTPEEKSARIRQIFGLQ
jgi:hypothetical protein